jgi:23S rRNA (adenine2503-C2)-methyltransferase
MNILRNIEVPTGNILVVEGERGKLECLSLGDYGKTVNLNQHKKVIHGTLLPLEEKWVCTISTQYGCSMSCTFCDVPMVGPGINATPKDILSQVETVIKLHPEVKKCERFNIHYARMGEPTFNHAVIESAIILRSLYPWLNIHPVVSTMMPKRNSSLREFIENWCKVKNHDFRGEAGLQLSINSTFEEEREEMFSGQALSLSDISAMMDRMPMPAGRKYTLNFALAEYTIDAMYLARLFSPDKFIVKITPMHKTRAAIDNGIETRGDYTEQYPYTAVEENLKRAGFEVLVFIASKEEDESRITCGNAILSDMNREAV